VTAAGNQRPKRVLTGGPPRLALRAFKRISWFRLLLAADFQREFQLASASATICGCVTVAKRQTRGGGGGADVSSLGGCHRRIPYHDVELQAPNTACLRRATISMVIKGGTKHLHATFAFYFGRTHALDAQNYMLPGGEPRLRSFASTDFGFNVGGPVRSTQPTPKLSSIYNMEWRRYIQGGLYTRRCLWRACILTRPATLVLPSTLANGTHLTW